jgi:hypothetical protein
MKRLFVRDKADNLQAVTGQLGIEQSNVIGQGGHLSLT